MSQQAVNIEARQSAELLARISAQPDPRRLAAQTLTNHQIDGVRRWLGEQLAQRDPRELDAALAVLGFA